MNLKSSLMVVMAGAVLALGAGCSSKNYVRQQSQPIIDKTNTLDELTAKNNRDVHDVDARSQQGIQGVNQKAAAADVKALDARNRADQAGTLATQAVNRVDSLATQVANLDSYRPVLETSVHFAFNKADLTEKAQSALDQLVAEIPNTKGYIVVVEGDTDSVGNASYNYKLSERRADAVVQYLSNKSVPAHKIFIIGYGKDHFVAENETSDGRAQNRRVDVRLMTNSTQDAPASAQTSVPNPGR